MMETLTTILIGVAVVLGAAIAGLCLVLVISAHQRIDRALGRIAEIDAAIDPDAARWGRARLDALARPAFDQ